MTFPRKSFYTVWTLSNCCRDSLTEDREINKIIKDGKGNPLWGMYESGSHQEAEITQSFERGNLI